MFFILSKLLAFLTQPYTWIFVLLILSILFRKRRFSKQLLILGVIILYFFSNRFICNEAFRYWEYPYVEIKSEEPYDYAVLLGGFSVYDIAFHKVKFRETGDRFIQTLQLYMEGKVKKIFISGGSGSLLHPEITEADKVRDFLLSMKVPPEDIIIEKKSNNTHENAIYTADWMIKNAPGARCLLVTSASHMRRAIGCYKKTGLNFIPYTTNRYTEPRIFDPDILLLPSAGCISKWDVLIKELIGTVTYKFMGYI